LQPHGKPSNVVQFGMYILFPIGVMYYFGTNLDGRFSVPDFWPKEGQTHRIPYEKDEMLSEIERLRTRRLALRAKRLEEEARSQGRQQSDEH
jgi:protein PET100, fungi type